jgi:hypothetical protein
MQNTGDPAFHRAVAREVEVVAMASYAVDTPSRWEHLLGPYGDPGRGGTGGL